jgi:hypothetical protein
VREAIAETVADHRQRITSITSLGVAHPQEALLLLTKTAVPRVAHLCQSTPLDLAEPSLSAAKQSINNAFATIAGIPSEDLTGAVTTQLSLPARWGGAELIDYTTIADSALVGSWATSATWIRGHVHGMADLGSLSANTLSPPMGGRLADAFARLQASGPVVRSLLPRSLEDLVGMDGVAKLQSKLTAAIHRQRFDDMHTAAVDAGDLASAVRLQALTAPCATAWQSVIPYDDSVQLAPPIVRAAIRFQLGLPQPYLTDARRRAQSCFCCDLPVSCTHGHHVLTTGIPTSLGGRHDTHEEVLRAIAQFLRDHHFHVRASGLHTLLPPTPNGHGLVPDLLVKGISNDHIATLIDVSITHPIRGDGAPVSMPGTREPLVAAAVRERAKVAKYGAAASAGCFAFVPAVLETYGGIGDSLHAFMKTVINKIVERRIGGTHRERVTGEDRESSPELVVLDGLVGGALPIGQIRGRLLLRWLRKLSIARVRSVASRLLGGGLDSLVGGR